ncbi:hypothetical protein, partial [Nostoc sp.]|uniref:hypothetical protein n=1 Tax=Nostoc sp. TaxID=1180 RepID=UPI002FF977F5
MMNIRRVLVVTGIPVLVGTFGFISLNQANAANQFHQNQIAQAQLPPNQPSEKEPRPLRPDFAAAAAKLGVSEAQLKDALGVPANFSNQGDRNQRPTRPNFAAAAAKLGVSEAQLKDALGVPANFPNQGDRNQRPTRPNFAAAAAKLGVSEAQLKDALGVPANFPNQG